ncbi:hypothetical protein J6590_001638 [Homalodisca vitripennis]|nr:hypothetical protein J6590_001638 [Homalodisca vitripennis]
MSPKKLPSRQHVPRRFKKLDTRAVCAIKQAAPPRCSRVVYCYVLTAPNYAALGYIDSIQALDSVVTGEETKRTCLVDRFSGYAPPHDVTVRGMYPRHHPPF